MVKDGLRVAGLSPPGIMIARWAKFLEKANYSLPRLLSKMEKENEQRGQLGKFRDMYRPYTCTCFYCDTELIDGKIEVDHFIPWTYMFDDAWNLVLACKDCNREKSDTLPKFKFKNKLLDRNREYHEITSGLVHSIKILKESGDWEGEIEKHYRLYQEHEFDMWGKEFGEKISEYSTKSSTNDPKNHDSVLSGVERI